LVENHGQAKERGSRGALRELDGLLELLLGIFDVSHTVVGKSHIVIGVERIGSECARGLKIRDAGLGVVFPKKRRALFKGARGFAWHGKLPGRNHGRVLRDWRLCKREGGKNKREEEYGPLPYACPEYDLSTVTVPSPLLFIQDLRKE
jgi:hypothetical protein